MPFPKTFEVNCSAKDYSMEIIYFSLQSSQIKINFPAIFFRLRCSEASVIFLNVEVHDSTNKKQSLWIVGKSGQEKSFVEKKYASTT